MSREQDRNDHEAREAKQGHRKDIHTFGDSWRKGNRGLAPRAREARGHRKASVLTDLLEGTARTAPNN